MSDTQNTKKENGLGSWVFIIVAVLAVMFLYKYISLINFDYWLFIAVIITGVVYLVDKLFFAKERYEKNKHKLEGLNKKEKLKVLKAPVVAEYCRSLFSVFVIVFILRAILFGNFNIPTGSMETTLPIGDFLIVNKTAYGVRMPFSNKVIIPTGQPKRGDIVVFHYPVYTDVDFIKRVIGVPGDKISYIDKVLYINGKEMTQTFVRNEIVLDDSPTDPVKIYSENLGTVKHNVIDMPWRKAMNFKDLVVPEGMYFVMGDNRDNSADSRYWGFVPEGDLVGKAMFVWMSWDSNASSIWNKVRWNEIGRTF
jgi:signal peptidase I